jgi:hypothetical protein
LDIAAPVTFCAEVGKEKLCCLLHVEPRGRLEELFPRRIAIFDLELIPLSPGLQEAVPVFEDRDTFSTRKDC